MRVAIRGFAGRQKIFEEVIETDGVDVENLARNHLERLLPYERHMVEFEFLDDPDPQQRFFRFGTDLSAMVIPIAIDLRKLK